MKAFTYDEILTLWINEDMCIWNVLTDLPEDELDGFIDYLKTRQQNCADCLEMITYYKTKKAYFINKEYENENK